MEGFTPQENGSSSLPLDTSPTPSDAGKGGKGAADPLVLF